MKTIQKHQPNGKKARGKFNFLTAALAVVSAIVLCGCATPPRGAEIADHPSQLTPIQQIYAKELRMLKTGMNSGSFLKILPKAYVAGENGDIIAYELSRQAKFVTHGDLDRANANLDFLLGFPWNARTYNQTLWFYFFNDKLIKWGPPNAWPTPADNIVEIRNR